MPQDWGGLRWQVPAVLLLVALWQLPILTSPLPTALRVVIAVALFALPGTLLQRLILGDAAGCCSRQLSLGFVLSVGLTGALGLMASLLGASRSFIEQGLLFATVALLLAGRPPIRTPLRWPSVLVAPALVAAALAARLAMAPELGDDDRAHLARIRSFLDAEHYGFADFVFEQAVVPPRYWLSYWPLVNALWSARAATTPFELLAIFAGPLLALLSLLAVYELARSLGFGPRSRAFAVVAQVACLLLSPTSLQSGGVFFNRLGEDKAVAAFVIAPVFLRLVAETLRLPSTRNVLLLGLGGVALVFTHPTLLGLTCLIAVGFCALDLLATRRRSAVLVAAVVLSLPIVPASFRFLGRDVHHLRFSVEEAAAAGDVSSRRGRMLRVLPGGGYALSAGVYDNPAVLVFAVAVAFGGLAWRSTPSARLSLAATGVLALAMFPQTAWIIGKGVTPFHIWRLPWLMPFGIAVATLAQQIPERLAHRLRVASWAPWLSLACLGLVAHHALSDPAAHFQAWPLPSDFRTVLQGKEPGAGPGNCAPRFVDLEALGRRLDGLLTGPTIVAGSRDMNSFVPALSARAKPFLFRNSVHTEVHAGVARPVAVSRERDFYLLTGRAAGGRERHQVLVRRGVRFLVSCGGATWVRRTQKQSPGSIRRVAKFGDLQLFRVDLPNRQRQ